MLKKRFQQCWTLVGQNDGEFLCYLWSGEKVMWCALPPSYKSTKIQKNAEFFFKEAERTLAEASISKKTK